MTTPTEPVVTLTETGSTNSPLCLITARWRKELYFYQDNTPHSGLLRR